MATDTELAMDRCPVCGHRSVSRPARLVGALIAGLITTIVVLGLVDLVILAARQL